MIKSSDFELNPSDNTSLESCTSFSIKHLEVRKLELHLIEYSLLSVVIPILTFSCGFVWLKVQQ